MAWKSQDAVARMTPEERATFLAGVTQLGVHPDTLDIFTVDNVNRFRGLLIEGIQGSGKSGLILTLAYQDALQRRGIMMLDPHRDLARDFLAMLPPDVLARVYWLDCTDSKFPYKLNLLAMAGTGLEGEARIAEINRITRVFKRVWPELETQANALLYLEAAVNVLLYSKGATLLSVHDFLTDEDFRTQVLARCPDPSLVKFWDTRYNNLSESAQDNAVGALRRRFDRLFVGKPTMQDILGQPDGLDFQGMIDRHEIVLIPLPLATMGDDARLLGTIIVSQIHQAIFRYASRVEKDRPGVSLYIDECQAFTTEDVGELLTQGRKYGMRAVLAHQYKSQLPADILKAAESCYIKVYFKLTGEDAAKVARDFGTIPNGIEITTDPLKHLLIHGHSHPVVRFWTDFYLRPLVARARSGKVEIDDKQWHLDWGKFIWGGVNNGGLQRVEGYVDNPAQALNHLLRECMRNGHANQVIPQDVAMAFGNAGRKFFAQARRAGLDKLGPNPKYPAHMARILDQGPETSDEELWRFLWCLRVVMETLADHPVGEEKLMSSAQVAAFISSLPTRHAWVHCGDERAVIKTFETPQKLEGDALLARFNHVLRQSRLKYTTPREQLHQAQAKPHQRPPEPPPAPAAIPTPPPQPVAPRSTPIVMLGEVDEEAPEVAQSVAVKRGRGRPPKARPPEPEVLPEVPEETDA